MSNTFIYESGWLVEKPERVMPEDYAAYCALEGASYQLGQSERDYNACVEYEKYLFTLRRFKYDYPDPKKEMELGKDFKEQHQFLGLPDTDHIWRNCTVGQFAITDVKYRRIIAVPLQQFNRGDKINLNTGYSCDIGFVEKDENGIVYWKHDLNDPKGRLYNSPKDKYNITLIEAPITQRTYSEQDLLDNDLKRLYDWVMDDNRKKAQTFFTAGDLRNVATAIEFKLFNPYKNK